MNASFRFRRQSCKPLLDVTVRLTAEPASGFTVRISPSVLNSLEPPMIRAVVLGVASAFVAIESVQPVAVSVIEVTDHSGSTSELGLNTCAAGAAYHLLGFPELAPHSGATAEA